MTHSKCPLYKTKIPIDATVEELQRKLISGSEDQGVCRYDREICGCRGFPGGYLPNCRLQLTYEQQKDVYALLKIANDIVTKAQTQKVTTSS